MPKVLIVEDDPLMARMYQKVFAMDGYEVEVAGDGQEGLDMVRKDRPTLVLMDIMMPKMNGLEALDKLKLDPDVKSTPVIMLTNLAGTQDAESALLKGAVKYIIKSEYDPKQVVDMVKEVLAGYTRTEVPQAAGVAQVAPTSQVAAPAPQAATSAVSPVPAGQTSPTTDGAPNPVPQDSSQGLQN